MYLKSRVGLLITEELYLVVLSRFMDEDVKVKADNKTKLYGYDSDSVEVAVGLNRINGAGRADFCKKYQLEAGDVFSFVDVPAPKRWWTFPGHNTKEISNSSKLVRCSLIGNRY